MQQRQGADAKYGRHTHHGLDERSHCVRRGRRRPHPTPRRSQPPAAVASTERAHGRRGRAWGCLALASKSFRRRRPPRHGPRHRPPRMALRRLCRLSLSARDHLRLLSQPRQLRDAAAAGVVSPHGRRRACQLPRWLRGLPRRWRRWRRSTACDVRRRRGRRPFATPQLGWLLPRPAQPIRLAGELAIRLPSG